MPSPPTTASVVAMRANLVPEGGERRSAWVGKKEKDEGMELLS